MANIAKAEKSVTYVIVGLVFQAIRPLLGVLLFAIVGFGAGTIANAVELIGGLLVLIGLYGLRSGFDDEAGLNGAKKLFTASIIGVVAGVLAFVPLAGTVAAIVGIVGYVVMLIGYARLKDSTDLNEQGRKGAGRLLVAAILMILAVVLGMLPLVGGVAGGVVGLIVLVMVLSGWGAIRGSFREALGSETGRDPAMEAAPVPDSTPDPEPEP